MRHVLALILIGTLTLPACGGDDYGPNGPDGGGLGNGSASARINGSAWTATIVLATVQPQLGSASGISMGDASRTLAFAWIDAGPGTYSIPASVGLNANYTVAGQTFSANSMGGSGTVTVTTRTTSRIAGSFGFMLITPGGGGAGATITEGKFDVTF